MCAFADTLGKLLRIESKRPVFTHKRAFLMLAQFSAGAGDPLAGFLQAAVVNGIGDAQIA